MRYGYRHLYAAGTNIVLEKVLKIKISSLAETIYHIAIGLLEFIPGIGHFIAFIDKSLNHRDIRIIKLTQTDPYRQGVEQGKALKNEIHFALKKESKFLKP